MGMKVSGECPSCRSPRILIEFPHAVHSDRDRLHRICQSCFQNLPQPRRCPACQEMSLIDAREGQRLLRSISNNTALAVRSLANSQFRTVDEDGWLMPNGQFFMDSRFRSAPDVPDLIQNNDDLHITEEEWAQFVPPQANRDADAPSRTSFCTIL